MTKDEDTGEDGAPPRRRVAKRLLRPLWILARPLLRPLAWRTRTFLLEATRQELTEIRAGQERLAAAQERLATALEAVAERTGGIAATLESALLTLAVPVPAVGAPPPEGTETPDQAA